jgi:carbon-monoxide dehydrogenase medium subunit
VEECVQALAESGENASLLAGGTDLIPKLRQGKLSISTVIDLAHIPDLDRIESDEQGILIGSMRRLHALQKEESLPAAMDALRQCAGHVSSMQVRNVATLGGNVCNASPAADTVPGLLVLDAIARISGRLGTREVSLESFFTGSSKTILGPDDLLTGFFIPHTPPNTGTAYRKYAIRGDSDVAIIGAAARITLDTDGRISAARIALASAGPTPLRMKHEEQTLEGLRPEAPLLKDVAVACAEKCSPITDQRASREYRKQMIKVWVEDALIGALAIAQQTRH